MGKQTTGRGARAKKGKRGSGHSQRRPSAGRGRIESKPANVDPQSPPPPAPAADKEPFTPGPWDARPTNRDELVTWVRQQVGVEVIGPALEYLCWTFFDGGKAGRAIGNGQQATGEAPRADGAGDSAGAGSPGADCLLPLASLDCVVWACRGGGKTYLAALATALDLIHKPGIQIKLLAGSIEQAGRMHEHLRSIFSSGRLCEAVKGRVTSRKVELENGSRASLMAASQASVRGARVHKLRCDEVELFTDEIWRAAQLVTKARVVDGREIPGSIECFSTMHEVGRLMSRLVRECEQGKRKLFRWGVMEVLGECGEGRRCRGDQPNEQTGKRANWQTGDGAAVHLPVLDGPRPGDCALWPECRGEAKRAGRAPGHLAIADAIAQKQRVGPEVWDSEMLCLRPRLSDLVLREFSAARHVVAETSKLANSQTGKSEGTPDASSDLLVCQFASLPVSLLVCGMDFGWRSPTVILWGEVDEAGVLTIVDERVVSGEVMARHVAAITESRRGKPEWVAIDPSGARMNEHTGVSNVDVLAAAGLKGKYRHWPVAPGLAKVRARLSPAGGSPPRLRVHSRCTNLIESLESYRYDPERPFSRDPLKDGSDHAVDALRYLVVALDGGEGTKTGTYW